MGKFFWKTYQSEYAAITNKHTKLSGFKKNTCFLIMFYVHGRLAQSSAY